MTFRVLFCAIALNVSMVVAQTVDGEIAGLIRDQSGAPLPGVRITVTNGAQSREAFTDSDGRFELRSLTVGPYRVVTTLPGFTSASGEIRLSSYGGARELVTRAEAVIESRPDMRLHHC